MLTPHFWHLNRLPQNSASKNFVIMHILFCTVLLLILFLRFCQCSFAQLKEFGFKRFHYFFNVRTRNFSTCIFVFREPGSFVYWSQSGERTSRMEICLGLGAYELFEHLLFSQTFWYSYSQVKKLFFFLNWRQGENAQICEEY